MYNAKYIFHKNKKIGDLLKKFSSLHPKEIDLSLGRIKKLLRKINNPHKNLSNIIHIAGTNGKGSTATIIFQLQKRAGRKVHVYRSPHLMSFNERIFINNKEISDKYLLEILDYIYKKNNNDPITFYEIITAAAFFAFSQNPSDLTILEVGLGGRFDATNVISKRKTTIITPIGYDHKNFLGNTLISIAKEKSGIINKNSVTICSKQKRSVKEFLLKIIDKRNNSSMIYGKDWKIRKGVLFYEDEKIDLTSLSLLGKHQYFNAGCAVIACKKNNNLKINNKLIIEGLQEINWPGRLQKLKGKLKRKYNCIDIWIDAAHNEMGFEVLGDWLKEKKINNPVIILGLGINKDLNSIVTRLKKIDPVLLCLVKNIKVNNHKPEVIKKITEFHNIHALISKNLSSSLVLCNKLMQKRKITNLIITGSIGLISEAIELD